MINGNRFGGQTCDAVLSQLDAYVDNELLVETSTQVLGHLERCGGCAREMELRGELKRRLRTASEELVAPPHLAASIRMKVDEQVAGERRGWWGRQMLAMAFVAVLCVGGVIAYQLGHLRLTA